MKNLYFLPCVLALTGVFSCAGCNAAELEGSADYRVITLMTWNIHNLFDGKDDGYEYAEFRQASGWSAEKYRGRINNITTAINVIEPLPDVIVFQEVESLQVIKDLALSLNAGYVWSHFANNPESGIGVGIISRFEILEGKSHSISINGETTPRPVLEARIQTETGDFVIFACHWKSKIGGDEATENVRMASARVILRRIRDLNETEPDIGIIVAGDLNENHNEFFKRGASAVCALISDDPKGASAAGDQKDFIVINGNMPPVPVYFPPETVTLYSPWVNELEFGSYYYKGNWETIDHFLVSHQFFDGAGLEYGNAFVVDFEPFSNRDGIPVSYNMKTGNGLSDHLPLLIYLKY